MKQIRFAFDLGQVHHNPQLGGVKMVKKKKRQKRLRVYNLKDEKEAREYYALLKQMSKRKLKAPILAKGFMRMVDLSKQLAKLDFYPPFESTWTRQERQLMNTI